MQTIEEISVIQKRARKNPTRKWTICEEKALVDFLMENREIEKPTSQIYYRRFAQEKSVPIEWKLVRSKVRNMRVCYNKAKSWENSTGAGSMERKTVKNTLLKMFSFFYEFDDIFRNRSIGSEGIQDSLECELDDLLNSTEIIENENTMTPENPISSENSMSSENNMSSESPTVEIEVLPTTSRKGIYSRTAVSDIMQVQSDVVQLKRQKLDQDWIIKEREMGIREREVSLKEKEMELREKEIQSNEKIKILELQMKERLAMAELNLKYK